IANVDMGVFWGESLFWTVVSEVKTMNSIKYCSLTETTLTGAKTINGEGQLQALVDGKKVLITESTIKRDLQLEDAEGVHCLPNAVIFEQLTLMGRKVIEVPQPSDPTSVTDGAVNEEMDDSLERAATTATSLDAEHDRGVNTPQSGKDSLKLNELMELCTKLQQKVLDLEATKTTRALEIDNLKKRVKKLERRKRSRTYGVKRLYKVGFSARVKSSEDEGLGEKDASKQGRITDIDANEDIYLVNVHNNEDMFRVNDLEGDEVTVKGVDVVEQAKEIIEDITLAKALMEIKSAKPKAVKVVIQKPEQGTTTTITATSSRLKAKWFVIHEQEQAPTTTVSLQQPSQVKDKGKGKMVEPKHVKKLSKKDQLMLDKELAFKLQAKKEEEEGRIARENAQQIEEVNIAWDDVQAKINVDYELAQGLQAEEQDELTDAKKAKLFMDFLDKRRNLKNKSFDNIQELFDKAMKRVNTFVDYKTELVLEESLKKAKAKITQKGSLKRAGDELEQERSKNRRWRKIKSLKSSRNVWKSFPMIKMLKDFDKKDLEVLWRLVKARFEKVKPVDHMDSFLLHSLKTMFEHHVEDNVWKNQQGLVKVKNWKLYDSYGFHCVTMQNILYYLLVEKIYLLTNHTLHQMFNDVKLQVNSECEMAFELLRLLNKQLKE
nr:hypothetical protein [Tanacetum cinerariifolium]